MKNTSKILSIALAAFGLFACTKPSIEPLEGKYPAPVDVSLTSLDKVDIQKYDGFRTIELTLSGQGNTLVVQMVSATYDLKPTTYTPAPSSSSKSGNYNSDYSSFNGRAIELGSIVVSCEGTSYKLSGVLQMNEKERYRVAWEGELVIEPDPEPVKLSKVLSAQSNAANGVNSVSLSLATKEVTSEFDMTTFQTLYKGSGNYASLDIYSADGYLHEGTYKACAVGGQIGEGEFGIGYDASMWGMTMPNWGSCWWTVDNGATSAVKILSGEITVSTKGSKFTIEYNDYANSEIWFVFEGTIEALTAPATDPVEVIALTKVLSATSNLANGTSSVTINLATEGVNVEQGMFGSTYTGTGNYAALDIYSADGMLHEGKYSPCSEGGKIGEGEFGIGWDPGDIFGWGVEMKDWGCCWWTVADGQTSAEKIVSGEITVSKKGEDFVVEYSGDALAFKFEGAIDALK